YWLSGQAMTGKARSGRYQAGFEAGNYPGFPDSWNWGLRVGRVGTIAARFRITLGDQIGDMIHEIHLRRIGRNVPIMSVIFVAVIGFDQILIVGTLDIS